MKYLIALVLLCVCCSSLDEDDVLLGCTEVQDKELCVYCTFEGTIKLTEGFDSGPFALCEDWCAYNFIATQIEGCKEYKNKEGK